MLARPGLAQEQPKPGYRGKTFAEWVDLVQNSGTRREAVEALAEGLGDPTLAQEQAQQVALITVGAESGEPAHPRANIAVASVNAHTVSAFEKLTPKSSRGLIADEQHLGVRIAEDLPQVVLDSACGGRCG